MKHTSITRRTFVRHSLLVAAAAGSVQPLTGLFGQPRSKTGNKPQSIRLGGPSYAKTEDPEELALAHRKLGYRAAYCPNVSLDNADRIRAISDAFTKHDVALAEVGRWCNLLDRDPEKRKKNLENVIDGLALADVIGARCCVNIAGSFSPKEWFGPHPDNLSPKFFDAVVENARKIIDAVKPKRTRLAYEMMGWALPDSPASYIKMIKAVDRPAFAVHLDPCNLINSPERFYRNADLLNESFDKLGRWIVSCHAKDLDWVVEMNVHFREVRPGAGALDYATYLRRVAALPQNPPLMIEHLPNAEEYNQARKFIIDQGEKIGLSFS